VKEMTEASYRADKIELHGTPPAERLRQIYALMKHGSFKKLPSIISSVLLNQPGDLQKFTMKVNGHQWHGYLYTSRNSLYGSIFSYYGRIPFIVRGFPKINYVESSGTYQREGVEIEEKVDGTNVIVWCFPDGTFWGKTRQTPTIFEDGYQGRRWGDLLEKTGYVDNLKDICTANFQVAMELYGKENPGEFVKYTIPISIKVLEICDLLDDGNKYNYRSPSDKRELCKTYNLPVVESKEICNLSQHDLDRLEYEAESFNHEDGMEGFVAKYYDGDVHMGKIKCSEIREACMGNKIPMRFINKAVRKCIEAGIKLMVDTDWESPSAVNPDAITFIKNELEEDFTETIVNLNEVKIKYGIENPKEEKEIDLATFEDSEIFACFDELKAQGIEISEANKGKVLSLTAGKLHSAGISGGRLFLTFRSYLAKEKS
jgi:hypothetical protein